MRLVYLGLASLFSQGVYMNELLAEQLLKLLREHKDKCNDPDCGVSTFMWLEEFKRLSGREPTKEEFKVFI